jgi:exonuclease SbcD
VRLLHTSDWHIGIKLGTYDYLPSQREFASWLVDTVKSEAIDIVLVAGDVFDKAIPSSEAVDLVDELLVNLIKSDVKVIVISGNHDSAERLNFCSKAMENAGLYIRTEQQNLRDIGEPIQIKKNGESVSIIPIPYLDPQRVIDIGEAERSHGGLIAEVLKTRVNEVADPSKTVVMSHAFVAGGTKSESEREISVGGTSRVAIETYKSFGYVALGHLHRPQPIKGLNMFYSGSPLQYSFSEEHQKSVRVIDFGDNLQSRLVDIPVGPKVVTLTDSLENLISDEKYDFAKNYLVRVQLTGTNYQLNPHDRLSGRFENILALSYPDMERAKDFAGSTSELLSHEEVVDQYVDAVHAGVVTPELRDFIQQSVQIVVAGSKQ